MVIGFGSGTRLNAAAKAPYSDEIPRRAVRQFDSQCAADAGCRQCMHCVSALSAQGLSDNYPFKASGRFPALLRLSHFTHEFAGFDSRRCHRPCCFAA